MSATPDAPYYISGDSVCGPGIEPIEFGRPFACGGPLPAALRCRADLNKAFALGVKKGRNDAEPALSTERNEAVERLASLAKEVAELGSSVKAQAEELAKGS